MLRSACILNPLYTCKYNKKFYGVQFSFSDDFKAFVGVQQESECASLTKFKVEILPSKEVIFVHYIRNSMINHDSLSENDDDCSADSEYFGDYDSEDEKKEVDIELINYRETDEPQKFVALCYDDYDSELYNGDIVSVSKVIFSLENGMQWIVTMTNKHNGYYSKRVVVGFPSYIKYIGKKVENEKEKEGEKQGERLIHNIIHSYYI